MSKVTKRQAERAFRELWRSAVECGQASATDKPALDEAWGMYIDQLCKAGWISHKQYHSWELSDEQVEVRPSTVRSVCASCVGSPLRDR